MDAVCVKNTESPFIIYIYAFFFSFLLNYYRCFFTQTLSRSTMARFLYHQHRQISKNNVPDFSAQLQYIVLRNLDKSESNNRRARTLRFRVKPKQKPKNTTRQFFNNYKRQNILIIAQFLFPFPPPWVLAIVFNWIKNKMKKVN